jgi:DNA-binding NtrC family response regulator
VAAGRFRRDLFYRLKVLTVHLPPLRQRADDLPLLVEHFLKQFNRDLGKCVRAASPEAWRLLEGYDWPGNVRELQGAIKFALLHAAGELVTPECLPENLRAASPTASPAPALDVARLVAEMLETGEMDIYRKVGLAVDGAVLGAVLNHVRGNQVLASELLGISRTTLRAKLRALGMCVEKQLQPEVAR